MMKLAVYRFIGIVLKITAIIGLCISIFAITIIWHYRALVTETFTANVDVLIASLKSVSEGLTLVETTLDTISNSLQVLQESLILLSNSVDASQPLVNSLRFMLVEGLPNTIESTQNSLKSAQSSAKIIDDLLRIITSIPFFPGEPYKPDIPLNIALAQVSESLSSLPQSFTKMENSLSQINNNLIVINADIEMIEADLGKIQQNLNEAQTTISYQRNTYNELIYKIQNVQKKLPAATLIIAWVLTSFLIWLAFSQIGLYFQGQAILEKTKHDQI